MSKNVYIEKINSKNYFKKLRYKFFSTKSKFKILGSYNFRQKVLYIYISIYLFIYVCIYVCIHMHTQDNCLYIEVS